MLDPVLTGSLLALSMGSMVLAPVLAFMAIAWYWDVTTKF